jgi:hypothetical protein
MHESLRILIDLRGIVAQVKQLLDVLIKHLLVHLKLHPEMLSPLSLYVHVHLNKWSPHFGSHSLISLRSIRVHQVPIDLILPDLFVNLLSKD